MFHSDFETLYKFIVVSDQADFDSWCNIVTCVNYHNCSKIQGRCMKATNVDDDKVCHYHRQPPMHSSPFGNTGAWFTPISIPYPDETFLANGNGIGS